jgi:hypothetical protein
MESPSHQLTHPSHHTLRNLYKAEELSHFIPQFLIHFIPHTKLSSQRAYKQSQLVFNYNIFIAL